MPLAAPVATPWTTAVVTIVPGALPTLATTTIGYHYYITRDGVVHAGRPLYTEGAHAVGYNRCSIGICYEGGLDIRGRPADTRTPEQKATMQKLLDRLKEDYPDARVVGHRDLYGVRKDCPCFEV